MGNVATVPFHGCDSRPSRVADACPININITIHNGNILIIDFNSMIIQCAVNTRSARFEIYSSNILQQADQYPRAQNLLDRFISSWSIPRPALLERGAQLEERGTGRAGTGTATLNARPQPARPSQLGVQPAPIEAQLP